MTSSYRWHTIQSIQERASQSKLWGLGIFIIMTIAFMISAILLVNSMQFTEINLLKVDDQPLQIPLLVGGILVSLYLSLLSAISVSRELDRGTLETLLYGPVDESTFLIGTFLAHMKVYIFSLAITLIWSNFCIWILNLSFNFEILGLLFASLVMSSELVAFGLFSAIWGGKARNATIYFILVILFLGGIQLADFIVAGLVQLNTSTVSDPMILVRNLLVSGNNIIHWISPFTQAQKAMQAIIAQQYGEYIVNISMMLFETALLIFGAILLLRKRV